jgi:hypothetical protein
VFKKKTFFVKTSHSQNLVLFLENERDKFQENGNPKYDIPSSEPLII